MTSVVQSQEQTPPLRVAIIGALGKQGRLYAQLLRQFAGVELACLVDLALDTTRPCETVFFNTVEQALEKVHLDVAFVCVPHSWHFELTEMLLQSGVSVIKEKPLALTSEHARRLRALSQSNGKAALTICQRQACSKWNYAFDNLETIGALRRIECVYHLEADLLRQSWRMRRSSAFGGVWLDMGYHFVDLIVGRFGLPNCVSGRFGYISELSRVERLEDVAEVTLEYPLGMEVSLKLSRGAAANYEFARLVGSRGSITVAANGCELQTSRRQVFREIDSSKRALIKLQVDEFLQRLFDSDFTSKNLDRHLANVSVIEAGYFHAAFE